MMSCRMLAIWRRKKSWLGTFGKVETSRPQRQFPHNICEHVYMNRQTEIQLRKKDLTCSMSETRGTRLLGRATYTSAHTSDNR